MSAALLPDHGVRASSREGRGRTPPGSRCSRPSAAFTVGLPGTLSQIIGDVLSRSLRLVTTGVFIGIVGALVMARTLESMLYDVAPYDPMTLVVVTLILGATTLLASLGPARRASRVDPMQTLRSE